jgi:transcriptional regulator with XRE-family HTH domain
MVFKVGRCRLRELRLGRGWTQDELSNKSGVSKSSISSFENGKRQMKVESVKNLIYALNCELDDLYDWKHSRR